MGTGKVIFGLLAGSAISAAIGMLFAPVKASERRKNDSQKRFGYVYVLGARYNKIVKNTAQQLKTHGENAFQRTNNVNYTSQEVYADRVETANHVS